LGLIAAVVLAHGSVIKAIAMIILGLLIGLVGTDGNTGGTRFTFGITELTDGIDVATLAIGVFGIGEIITNLTQPQDTRSLVAQKITRLWPTGEDFRRAWPAVLRGTALGSILGVLPGGGATLSAFAAYVLGHDRQHVDRQLDACDHHPAAHRHVGSAVEGTVPVPLSRDPVVLRNRSLHREQQRDGGAAGGVLRRCRLCLHPARMRARADDPRLRAGSADGGEPAPRDAHFERRPDDFPATPDQSRPFDRRAGAMRAGGAACHPS